MAADTGAWDRGVRETVVMPLPELTSIAVPPSIWAGRLEITFAFSVERGRSFSLTIAMLRNNPVYDRQCANEELAHNVVNRNCASDFVFLGCIERTRLRLGQTDRERVAANIERQSRC